MRHEIMLRLVVVYRDGQLASKFTTIPLYMILVGAMLVPLSGYIGGNSKGGYWVEKLAEEWATVFDVKYTFPLRA